MQILRDRQVRDNIELTVWQQDAVDAPTRYTERLWVCDANKYVRTVLI